MAFTFIFQKIVPRSRLAEICRFTFKLSSLFLFAGIVLFRSPPLGMAADKVGKDKRASLRVQAPEKGKRATTQARNVNQPTLENQTTAGKGASSSEASSGEIVDMVLASIDGDPVTMSDLKHFMLSHGENTSNDLLDGSQVTRKYLRDMVVEELLSREAKASNIAVGDEEIAAYIDEIKSQNRVDEAGFEEILKTKGMSVEEYRSQVRTDIIRTRVVSAKVRGKINVLDDEIVQYVKEHPQSSPKHGEVHVQQVFFKAIEKDGDVDSAELNRLKKEAEELRERVVEGKSMEALGEESFSDLGYINPDDLRTELQSAVSALQPGEVSPVVETPAGYYVFRVVPGVAAVENLDEVTKTEIRREIYEKRFKAALDKFLNDELPKKYHVELKL